jgi:outer membrane protein assembly factor BamB
LTGGPVIDREGMLYIAGRVEDEAGVLYALSPAGEPVWEVALSDEPVGSPAIDAEGTIYVADRAGLTAVTPAGEIRWRADAPDGNPAVSSPVAFPNGATVYKSLSGLVALASSGDLLWHTLMTDTRSTSVPHLSVDGQTVFWNELGFELETGVPVTWTVPAISGNPDLTQVVIGADGERYWQRGAALVQDMTPAPEEEVTPFFDLRQVTWQGADAGVTPGGRPWLAARPSVGGMGLGFFWGDAQGELSSKIDIPDARNARVLAVDAQETAYICADAYQNGTPVCVAMGSDAARPLWRLPLRGLGAISGAALAPGRLYVATWDGNLLAVGDD